MLREASLLIYFVLKCWGLVPWFHPTKWPDSIDIKKCIYDRNDLYITTDKNIFKTWEDWDGVSM